MPLKISDSVNFKSAKLPSKKNLVGKYSILAPLNFKNHTEELFKNFSLDKTNTLWTYMPYGPFKNLSSFKNYLKKHCLNKEPFFYTIYSKKLKSFCGLASYLRIKPKIGTIEVGWITYASNLQRTVEATEAMYLMMKNVFENLGYRRYEWKCDNLNQKSKKSAQRLGFKFEGVLGKLQFIRKEIEIVLGFQLLIRNGKNIKKNI